MVAKYTGMLFTIVFFWRMYLYRGIEYCLDIAVFQQLPLQNHHQQQLLSLCLLLLKLCTNLPLSTVAYHLHNAKNGTNCGTNMLGCWQFQVQHNTAAHCFELRTTVVIDLNLWYKHNHSDCGLMPYIEEHVTRTGSSYFFYGFERIRNKSVQQLVDLNFVCRHLDVIVTSKGIELFGSNLYRRSMSLFQINRKQMNCRQNVS